MSPSSSRGWSASPRDHAPYHEHPSRSPPSPVPALRPQRSVYVESTARRRDESQRDRDDGGARLSRAAGSRSYAAPTPFLVDKSTASNVRAAQPRPQHLSPRHGSGSSDSDGSFSDAEASDLDSAGSSFDEATSDDSNLSDESEDDTQASEDSDQSGTSEESEVSDLSEKRSVSTNSRDRQVARERARRRGRGERPHRYSTDDDEQVSEWSEEYMASRHSPSSEDWDGRSEDDKRASDATWSSVGKARQTVRLSDVPSLAPSLEGGFYREEPEALDSAHKHRSINVPADSWVLSLDTPESLGQRVAPPTKRVHIVMDETALRFEQGNTDDGQGRRRHKRKKRKAPKKPPPPKVKKSKTFWMIMLSLMLVALVSSIDMTIIPTSLATIVEELPASTVPTAWVTSSFLLTTTAFQPLMGGLADVVGRRNSMALSLILFLAGSIVCALAHSVLVLVVGRSIQGVGAGGIQALTEIILSDITSLRERGAFVGLISLVFSMATYIGPLLGGIFSQHNWRWIFWINVPICACAMAMVLPFMKLRTPQIPLSLKIKRMDIPANMLLLAAATGLILATTEGGTTYPWSDKRVYIPLIAGSLGILGFFAIELIPNRLAPEPVVHPRLFTLTTGSCFAMSFLHGFSTYGAGFLYPIFFQAIQGSSPLKSAVQSFPSSASSAPFAIVAGVLMAITGKYKGQLIFWWAMMIVGFSLLLLWKVDVPAYLWVTSQLVTGIPVGALFTLTLPPIQAALPATDLASATATFVFMRSLGTVFGIALTQSLFTATVNKPLRDIAGTAEAGLRGATALEYTTMLKNLPPPLIRPVREAYVKGFHAAYLLFVPANGLGLLMSFLVKSLPLPDFNDSEYGIAGEGPAAQPGLLVIEQPDSKRMSRKSSMAKSKRMSSNTARRSNSTRSKSVSERPNSRRSRKSLRGRPDELGIEMPPIDSDVLENQAQRAKMEAYLRAQRHALQMSTSLGRSSAREVGREEDFARSHLRKRSLPPAPSLGEGRVRDQKDQHDPASTNAQAGRGNASLDTAHAPNHRIVESSVSRHQETVAQRAGALPAHQDHTWQGAVVSRPRYQHQPRFSDVRR